MKASSLRNLKLVFYHMLTTRDVRCCLSMEWRFKQRSLPSGKILNLRIAVEVVMKAMVFP